MDFSFSSNDGSNAEKEDWEIQADKAAIKNAPEPEEAAYPEFQEEKLDDQIVKNQQELRRDEQNQKIVENFLDTADSESSDAEPVGEQRDYTAENEFMAGNIAKTHKDTFDVKLSTYEEYDRFGVQIGGKLGAFHRIGEEMQFVSMMKKLVDQAFDDMPAEHLAALGKFCYDRANEAIRGKGATKAKKTGKKPQINTYSGKAGKLDIEDDFM